MDFYTNVFQRGNKIYVRGYDKGLKVTDVVHYKPYMFLPKQEGKYRTLDGKPVDKMEFDDIRDARDFIERYKDVSNMEIYGLTTFPYLYIYDNFKGEINYDPSKINVVTLDLECGGDDIYNFPNIELADQPITAISIKLRNKIACFGLKDFTPNSENVYYLKCKDERDLIQKFLQVWESKDWSPDILTGWNIEFFDIPYLVTRIKNLFGEKEIKRLSPWKIVDERIVEFRAKENKSYTIQGITVLDYYQLYRKFMFGNQESYKLDFIAQIELGENKIDYSEYGSLNDLYRKNFQLYMEYNIHDVVLVDRLDDKLKFIEQVMALAYDAKVNFSDTLTTVRPWDIIIHNYLLEQNIVIPQMKKQSMNESLIGGFVKEPKVGLNDWVVSFDLNSMYPHLIMQYNISAETYVGKMDVPSIDDILDGHLELSKFDTYSVAANGCIYSKLKQGFLPALMERMYNDRTKYKKLMLEAKQRYEDNPNSDDEKLISRYHNMQMARKIQLNSAYGALGNQYFRWFNFDMAESITMSGQLAIRWIERKLNQYMNKMLKTNKDYVIASDTDSIYVEMKDLVNHLGKQDERSIVAALDKFCEEKIQPYLDQCYQELADYTNAYQQKMKMKRETIANKGIWKAKKMYILNAWNVEGVQYNEPKLKIQGIEAVRSSTPYVSRVNIKKALTIIMNSSQDELKKFIDKFREEFMELPFEDIAFPRGVKGLYKYTDKSLIYKKSTPIHVKGALIFNNLLKQHDIKSVRPISDGDKIKFAYLKIPNPIHESVIATADVIPKEFNLDKYIDRDMQFQKAFLEPLMAITKIINWETEDKSTLEDFFV
jgi:DNA polymerase elongation subunit (family B)